MKNKILSLSALAILLTGCSLGTNNSQSTNTTGTDNTTSAPIVIPQESSAPISSNTIIYNENGFSPNSLTVKVGTTVTFTNQGSGSMWVGSNPHPSHTDLPGFDEKSSAANGESYSYSFTKVGTWGFHNHKNPSHSGAVIVTE